MTANDYAKNEQASRDYLVSRRVDTDKLMKQGITNLPYVQVNAIDPLTSRQVVVNGVVCESPLCAVAYILAKFW